MTKRRETKTKNPKTENAKKPRSHEGPGTPPVKPKGLAARGKTQHEETKTRQRKDAEGQNKKRRGRKIRRGSFKKSNDRGKGNDRDKT